MNLGERIRAARLNAGMTQSELAGDFITRNMLSQIENGLAMPSLQTALYIADKLGLDAGILFSDGDNKSVYFLTRKLPLLKKSFADRDYDGCIQVCSEEDELCDEAYLIMAECYVKKAYELYEKGKLRHALKFCENAVKYASKTVYSSDSIKYKTDILETVISYILPSIKQTQYGDIEKNYFVSCYVEQSENREYILRQKEARSIMEEGNYAGAFDILKNILKEKKPCIPFEYALYCDAEICCRELKDFENAYKYSQLSKKLLEDMQQ